MLYSEYLEIIKEVGFIRRNADTSYKPKMVERNKQYKYLFRRMLDEANIKRAYKNLRRGKTKRREIKYIDAHYEEEAEKMRIMILNTRPGAEHPELGYHPPINRKVKHINEHGKDRRIYMPEIHEQWLHHIIILILGPIITRTAYRYSCGSIPKRGAHYGAKYIQKYIAHSKASRNFAKLDIRHFYDNTRISIIMRELATIILDDWFLYVISLCFYGFDKGIPLGFYISQWLANFLLEPVDRFIVDVLRIPGYCRYMDDMWLADNAKKLLHKAVSAIKMLLGRMFRLKLKHNYQVIKFEYVKKNGEHIGRPIDMMGFVFYRSKTLMRKYVMLNTVRLVHHLHKEAEAGKRWFTTHIRAVLSGMGWFKHTNSYDCYLKHIKPCINIGKLKHIISKIDKRERKAFYDKLGRRALFSAA